MVKVNTDAYCSASRSSVIPNSSTLVTGADSAYSQAASDSYVSSSTSGGLTPNSSASSQIPFGYSNSSSSGHPGSLAQKQRYWLHIRQQPRACRACSNSRDRRVIDPPPVVQLQISDFDPHSQHDMEDMMNQSFIVQCLLISANAPWTDMSLAPRQDDSDGTATTEKQIYGNLSASPLFCEEDPDPATAPRHPSTQLSHSTQISPANAQRTNLPATFFYYPDISIRRPGAYRLEFKLVKVNLNQRQCPVLHSVRSEPFNVVNAKDFDHVQPSTPLVRGLIARGAGFPLKLKQGSRASRTSFDE